MGWEQRGGRRYYYRKVREGGRVRSEYMGAGPCAELIAAFDDWDRLDRQCRRDEEKAELLVEDQLDRRIAEASWAVASITHATLAATGHHKHKGQWRKIRNEQ
jgi:hypothetical protein